MGKLAKSAKLSIQEEFVVAAFHRGVKLGLTIERENLVTLIELRQCFDMRDNGNCDDQACWALRDLVTKIRSMKP